LKSSLQIALEAMPRPITDIADRLGLRGDEWEPYGQHKAKIRQSVLERLADAPDGRLIVVTAITPTPLGEGKTTTSIGLAQGLNRIGVHAALTIRQPSLGPVFGIKGGGAGGGYSQVLPMEDVNLHLNGDMHAVAAAHNLGAAFIDNHLFHGNPLGIDAATIRWPRVLDVNDRALRQVTLTHGKQGEQRRAEFHITPASEVMAILALAADLHDLRRRIGRAEVADTTDGTPVTLDELRVAGAMTVVMREAIKPNLVQTLEGGPAIVHAGPFANIAHGNSSVIADRIALKLAHAVVTEGGFGSDMGFQKFIDIKCRLSGLRPAAAVIVATIRALKMHGGVGQVVAGKPPDPALAAEDPDGVRRGCENLVRHIEIVRTYGLPAVVAINAYPTDAPSEVDVVREIALAAGAHAAVVSEHFARGGEGARELATAVWQAANGEPAEFRLLSPEDATLVERIEAIATRIYGGDGIELLNDSAERLARYEQAGHGQLPVCMAKTALSLSHDPKLKGRPTGFRVPIRDVRLYAGAGFVTAYCGDMLMMPGLPSAPAGEQVDIDENGGIVGLF
jgi:formate--tetrahydrofolate ligase